MQNTWNDDIITPDTISVSTRTVYSGGDIYVAVDCVNNGCGETPEFGDTAKDALTLIYLSPNKAREIANFMLKAADEAEGKRNAI